MIRGVYGHPQPLWDTGATLDAYHVNAVFVHGDSIDQAMIDRARAEGCHIFAEFATLNGRYGNYVEQHPDAHPIDDAGHPVPPATWFLGVCPTHQGFRDNRMQALRDMLSRFDLDGVWMDYVHWHAQFEDPYPILVKTCFNESCLQAFQRWANIDLPGTTAPERSEWIFEHVPGSWEDWRVSVLVNWAREMREIIQTIRPGTLLGCFHVAWTDEDLGGVRRRCLGLDIREMARYVDIFSPMPYHGRSGHTPEYVQDYVEYFSDRYPVKTEPGQYPRLCPIVQAHDDPRVTPEEFERVLRYGLRGKSSGVMMFTIGSVAADAGKMEVMKRVYGEFV